MDELQKGAAVDLQNELRILNRLIKKAFRLGLKIDVQINQVHSTRAPYPMPMVDAGVSDGVVSGFIHGPDRNPDDPDRPHECEEALETGIKKLISRAVGTGWSMAEVTTAISQLADHEMLANDSMDQTSALLNRIKKNGL